jgi:hypothetical protein
MAHFAKNWHMIACTTFSTLVLHQLLIAGATDWVNQDKDWVNQDKDWVNQDKVPN